MGAAQAPDRHTRQPTDDSGQGRHAAGARHRLSARLSQVPEILWAPSVVTGLIVTIGLLAILFNQPWLFASLGPTAYLIAHSPKQPAAAFYNAVVGHLIAVASGFLVVALIGADDAPSLFVTHHLVGIRVLASAVALGLAIAGELLLRASHPPAAATVLLITLGGFSVSVHSAVTIMVGVVLLALLGEPLRRLRART
jgi:CBS-domain-containing membrane protein